MHISHHARQRMCQRGISRRLVEFALRYGRVDGDKYTVDRNESRRIIEALSEDLRLARQVLDKGGVTVVEEAGSVVTTYNPNIPMRHGKALAPFIPHRKAPAPFMAHRKMPGSFSPNRKLPIVFIEDVRHG